MEQQPYEQNELRSHMVHQVVCTLSGITMQLCLVGTLVLIIFSTRTQATEDNINYGSDESDEYDSDDDYEVIDKYFEEARAKRLQQQQLLNKKFMRLPCGYKWLTNCDQ
uniref:Uncharacterized protein n=1 Tax=Glossina palpalis gambiensis TaxID=67801 RepID=A0A1B0B0W5_9MUSC